MNFLRSHNISCNSEERPGKERHDVNDYVLPEDIIVIDLQTL